MATQPTVYVGMSGGVDSSVAAALLKEQGYNVTGVFLHFWSDDDTEGGRQNACCSIEAFEDARRVANHLGIELKTFNVAAEFKQRVVDYYLREYNAGRTPNPCILCNEYIKFGMFIEKAEALGAEYVATGHYARKEIQTGMGDECTRVDYYLKQGVDITKDQAYYLYRLTQKKLAKVLLPLGEYTKPEIRTMAEERNIPVAEKKDSQSLCFIPWKSNASFLKKYLTLEPGPIVDENGAILGTHDGLPLYTIGQRKGLNIGGSGPYYVLNKDATTNTLHITSNPDELQERLNASVFDIEGLHWISHDPPETPLSVNVMIRTHDKAVPGTLDRAPKETFVLGEPDLTDEQRKDEHARHESLLHTPFRVTLEQSKRAVTEGQSAVFVDDEGTVLGGGVIHNVLSDTDGR